MKYKTSICRQLRKDMTPSERILWERLRRKQLGAKFRRQHPIGPYIVDFYCHSARLIVEIDGEIHLSNKSQDLFRDKFCEELGYKIIRVTNQDVLNSLDEVCKVIRLSCIPLPSPPHCDVGRE